MYFALLCHVMQTMMFGYLLTTSVKSLQIRVLPGGCSGQVAGTEDLGQSKLQGQVLQWLVGDHADQGAIQGGLQGKQTLLSVCMLQCPPIIGGYR